MIAQHLRKSSRGQSIIEFAIVLPVLLLLVMGVIDFGRVYFAYVSVTNGARNGAEHASHGVGAVADTDAIREAVLADTSDLLNTSETNPQVTVTTGTDAYGGVYADVTVNYTYGTIFPWPGLPDSINLARTVRARIMP